MWVLNPFATVTWQILWNVQVDKLTEDTELLYMFHPILPTKRNSRNESDEINDTADRWHWLQDFRTRSHSQHSTHVASFNFYSNLVKVATISIPILQMEKLRHRGYLICTGSLASKYQFKLHQNLSFSFFNFLFQSELRLVGGELHRWDRGPVHPFTSCPSVSFLEL